MNLRFYTRVARNYLHYHFGFPKPVLVGLRVTGRCNLNCNFCDVKNCRTKEIDTRTILKAIDSIDKGKVAFLTVTGGEPLMRKDFAIVSNKLGKSGLCVSLNTNGTLINDKNADLIADNYDIVRISIDGNEELHDRIRGVQGAFKKTREGVKLLLRKSRKSKICINCVITPENLHCMEEVVREWGTLADSFSFMPVAHYSRGDAEVYSSKKFLDDYNKICKKWKINQVKGFMKPDVRIGKKNCDAGKLYYHIMPDGNVTPCSNLLFGCNLGNICEEDFSDVIDKSLKSNQIKRINDCPGCFSRCTTEVSMLMRKNPIQILSGMKDLLNKYKF